MPSRFSPLALAVAAGLLAAVFPGTGWGDEFSDMAATMGTATTLIGTHQMTTTNPDLTSINFWAQNPAAYEGALANGAPPVPLSNPHMAQADAYGNIYIADKASHSVLKITTDGRVHTFAGTHVVGFNGDGPAPATTLQLNNPNGLFVFPDGTVYLLDPGNRRIRRVGTDGIMTTIVTNPATEPGQTPNNGYDWYPSGRALWVSPDQQLIYYTNEFAPIQPAAVGAVALGATVKKWTPAGGIEVVCSKAVGFRNPGNIAVSPIDGKLYVTDRAEEDGTRTETGLYRIEGPEARSRISGFLNAPLAADGRLIGNSYIEQPRGIAFLPNGAYFLCTHKALVSGSIFTSDVWYVDTVGVLHKFIQGKGKSDDSYLIGTNHAPPFNVTNLFNQARAVSIAPNGSLLVVSNDSGYVFRVNNLVPHLPADLRSTHFGADGLRLSWSGLFSRGYLIQRTGSLAPPSWQTIGAAGGFATGVPSEFLDPAATGQSADFYRLAPAP